VQSSISYSLGANVENLTLTGSGALSGTGNALNNVITGNSGDNFLSGSDGNDSLDGGSGNDQLDGGTGDNTLAGGLGNDRYYVRSATDVLIENVGEGSDVVVAYVDYTLADNIENLDMQYTAFVGTGNALNNVLIGNNGNNTFNGGAGIDTLIGGYGSDIYIVDSTTDTIIELDTYGSDQGYSDIDTVQTSVTLATLAAFVENLQLIGASAINGTGNELDNLLLGNSRSNVLEGGAGNDTLDGGGAADTLRGGMGSDTYRLRLGSGTDTIQENDGDPAAIDTVVFGSGWVAGDMSVSRAGNDLRIAAPGGADAVVLANWYLGSQYQVEQFIWSDGSVTDAQGMESRATGDAPPMAPPHGLGIVSLMRLHWADFEAAMSASSREGSWMDDEVGLGDTAWNGAPPGLSPAEPGSYGPADLGQRRGFGSADSLGSSSGSNGQRRQLASMW
jgi:Ca2+-binding RTX toxin-like protein